MREKNKYEGYCRICNKYGKLTFEHIPPKCALNDKAVRIYTGDSYIKLLSDPNRYPWEIEGIRYKSLQKGLGDYTLCEQCNNLTGELYGEEYKKWFYTALKSINENKAKYKKAKHVVFQLKGVYPGRFIRQVLSIISSTYPGFTKKYSYVRKLILDKNYIYKGIPDFKIYMYLLKNPYNGYTGLTGIMLVNGIFKLINEIDLYPFGFYLSLSKEEENEMNITKFIKCSYNDVGEVELTMNVHEKNNIVPMDFRSKDEIIDITKLSKNNN